MGNPFPTAKRDMAAAKRFFDEAMAANGAPDKVALDRSGANKAAIDANNAGRDVPIVVRQVKCLNNVAERNHRAIKFRLLINNATEPNPLSASDPHIFHLEASMGALIGRIWAFVSTPANLAVLVALAGGVGFAWNKFSTTPAPSAPASQTATAGDGGVAVNAGENSTVSIVGQAPATASNPAPTAPSAPAVNQTASATAGGVAVNTTGAAQVHVPQAGGVRK